MQLIIMPKAYLEDLRWCAVWLHLIHCFSYAEIAEVLFMCKKSVMRYIDLFNSTGSVAPTEQIIGPQELLTEFEQLSVVQSVLHQPGIYLHEVQNQLYCATEKLVHVSTICRTLSRLGLTRQKM